MSDFFYDNINLLLRKTGLSSYALAEKLGIEASTVYRWLDPATKSVPRSRTQIAVAEFFGIDHDSLVNQKLNEDLTVDTSVVNKPKVKEPKKTIGQRIPLVKLTSGLVEATLFDTDIETDNGQLTPSAEKWLPTVPEELPGMANLVAIHAKGSAMAPTIQDGDLVYVAFLFENEHELPEVNEGDLVLAESINDNSDRTPIIRKLVYGDDEQDKWLMATNPDWPGTKTVRCHFLIGKVMAIFRRIKP